MLQLELWCQASPRMFLGRPHLVKTVLCSGWSDRIVSYGLGTWRRGWGICMAWGMNGNPSTTGSCPMVTVAKDPQGIPCWLPTTAVFAWSGHRDGRTWQWPIGSMSSSVTSPVSKFTRQMAGLGYVVLPGERFQQRWQAYRVQAVGGSVHVCGAFHSGAKPPLVLTWQIPRQWALQGHFTKHLSAICQAPFRG